MRTKYYILSVMTDGSVIGTLLLFAYTISAYSSITGYSLSEIVHLSENNTLYYLAIGFYLCWYISIWFYYSKTKVCKKYQVDVIT